MGAGAGTKLPGGIDKCPTFIMFHNLIQSWLNVILEIGPGFAKAEGRRVTVLADRPQSALGSASTRVFIFGTALGCLICARLHRGDTGKVQR